MELAVGAADERSAVFAEGADSIVTTSNATDTQNCRAASSPKS